MPSFNFKFPNGNTTTVAADNEEEAQRQADLMFGVRAKLVKKSAPKKASKKSTAKTAGAKAAAKKPANTPSQQPTRESNTKPGTTTPDVTGK